MAYIERNMVCIQSAEAKCAYTTKKQWYAVSLC